MSLRPIMLECLKNLNNLISLHRFLALVIVEKGFAIFFIAKCLFVFLLRALHTMPYAP